MMSSVLVRKCPLSLHRERQGSFIYRRFAKKSKGKSKRKELIDDDDDDPKWNLPPVPYADHWKAAAEEINWFTKYEQLHGPTKDGLVWFLGGMTNACFNAIDVHVEAGRGDQVAIYWDSPVTSSKRQITYNELLSEVTIFAGALAREGVKRNDRVLIYNPAIPETMIAMLACARIGAIHSVVFGGFSSQELAVRIDDCTPKIIVSASCGVEKDKVIPYKPLLDEALNICKHKVKKCIITQREKILKADLVEGRDITWTDAIKDVQPVKQCLKVLSNHPLYILYTSGTTGKPKGVVRDTGGHIVALKWTMKNIYGVDPGDTFWAASDLGWVVGHSYICYGPLLQGCSTVLFEGKPVTPDAGAYWRVLKEYNVKSFFTAPTAIRAIKKEDSEGKFYHQHKPTNLEHFFLAGEKSDSATVEWLNSLTKLPIKDHWWMTETGYPITAPLLGHPVKTGTSGKPIPGFDISILDQWGIVILKPGVVGSIHIDSPLPPGTLLTLWNDEDRFYDYFVKFPGYFHTGDAGMLDQDGHVIVVSRTDDVINVAGHRLGTSVIEDCIGQHPAVAECCVFGMSDEIKGEVPMGLFVLKNGIEISPKIHQEIIEKVRKDLGAVYSFKNCLQVERLPKTRSGKILRSTLKKMVNGEETKVPATIEDPAVLNEIKQTLQKNNFIKEVAKQ